MGIPKKKQYIFNMTKDHSWKLELEDFYIDIVKRRKPTPSIIDAYENFISDHPGSVFREVAFYGRVEASYNRAISSVPAVQKERLLVSKDFYAKYLKYYKAGDKKEDADALIAAIDKELEKYQQPTEN